MKKNIIEETLARFTYPFIFQRIDIDINFIQTNIRSKARNHENKFAFISFLYTDVGTYSGSR